MAISVPFTGGCGCGAIRYERSAAPLFMVKCHCQDCQRASGSAFATNVWVPVPALTFTKGEPKYYGVKGFSGNTVYRSFCPDCGLPLGAKADAVPEFRMLSVASLDDPSGLEPVMEGWTSSAHPWDILHPDIPQFETRSTDEEVQALLASGG